MSKYCIVLDILVMETQEIEAETEQEAIELAMQNSTFGRDGEMSLYSIQKLPDGKIIYAK